MCRMILAQGNFSTSAVFEAAVAMSRGVTATHECPIKQHSDGWGCLWFEDGEIRTMHSDEWLAEEAYSLSLNHINSSFLAIHVRHATLATNQGKTFSHPVMKSTDAMTWYMMHNGFLPTVHKNLCMEQSTFDSAEYLEYIISDNPQPCLSSEWLNRKIACLEPGGSAANAFFVNNIAAYAYQRYPEYSPFSKYFTMSVCKYKKATYVASEMISTLATISNWRQLNNGELIKFKL